MVMMQELEKCRTADGRTRGTFFYTWSCTGCLIQLDDGITFPNGHCRLESRRCSHALREKIAKLMEEAETL